MSATKRIVNRVTKEVGKILEEETYDFLAANPDWDLAEDTQLEQLGRRTEQTGERASQLLREERAAYTPHAVQDAERTEELQKDRYSGLGYGAATFWSAVGDSVLLGIPEWASSKIVERPDNPEDDPYRNMHRERSGLSAAGGLVGFATSMAVPGAGALNAAGKAAVGVKAAVTAGRATSAIGKAGKVLSYGPLGQVARGGNAIRAAAPGLKGALAAGGAEGAAYGALEVVHQAISGNKELTGEALLSGSINGVVLGVPLGGLGYGVGKLGEAAGARIAARAGKKGKKAEGVATKDLEDLAPILRKDSPDAATLSAEFHKKLKAVQTELEVTEQMVSTPAGQALQAKAISAEIRMRRILYDSKNAKVVTRAMNDAEGLAAIASKLEPDELTAFVKATDELFTAADDIARHRKMALGGTWVPQKRDVSSALKTPTAEEWAQRRAQDQVKSVVMKKGKKAVVEVKKNTGTLSVNAPPGLAAALDDVPRGRAASEATVPGSRLAAGVDDSVMAAPSGGPAGPFNVRESNILEARALKEPPPPPPGTEIPALPGAGQAGPQLPKAPYENVAGVKPPTANLGEMLDLGKVKAIPDAEFTAEAGAEILSKATGKSVDGVSFMDIAAGAEAAGIVDYVPNHPLTNLLVHAIALRGAARGARRLLGSRSPVSAAGAAVDLLVRYKKKVLSAADGLVVKVGKKGRYTVPAASAILNEATFEGPYAPRKKQTTGEAFEAAAKRLTEAHANPDRVREGVMAQITPEMAAKASAVMFINLAEAVVRRNSFLYEKLPKPVQALFTGKSRWSASPADVQKFARYVRAAKDPLVVLDDMAHNRVTPEAVETIKELYPETYKQLQMKLLEKLPKIIDRMDYGKKLQLSLLFGVAADDTMQPGFVHSMQQTFASKEKQAEGGSARKPISSAKKFTVGTEPTPAQGL